MAQRLQACARQLHDTEAETMLAEIKLRALRTIGEMSKELQKAPHGPGRGKRCIGSDTPLKNQVLKAAGISRVKASTAERIARIPQEEFERHITRARKDHRPIRIEDLLRTVVRGRQLKSQRGKMDWCWRDNQTQIVGVIAGELRPLGRIWEEAQHLLEDDSFKLILMQLEHHFNSNSPGTDFNPHRQLLLRLLQGESLIESVLRQLSQRPLEQHRFYFADLMHRRDEIEDFLMVDWTEATFGLSGKEVGDEIKKEKAAVKAAEPPVGVTQD
jgi:hypothetical protein